MTTVLTIKAGAIWLSVGSAITMSLKKLLMRLLLKNGGVFLTPDIDFFI